MKKLHYQIKINAEPEKVWTTLWEDMHYRQWSSAFCKGSFYQGTLDEGSTVKFFDPENNGMYSQVIKNVPNQEMVFLHQGEIHDGIEVPQDWENATESYVLQEFNNETFLKVEVNSSEEFEKFFEEAFPKALQNVKNLAENQL
ncbi:SRPBCC domain-containing protein [Chryseobacterium echinoideorum]|uniref:SRPBCC domain-containing protein n=1 Tax=Chryseobacterium echinoideorum TaxID=1549648 RepID=UPI0011869A67|nr:SRPBCC domain-containing protein [Chryseobacterium echinoideorum]